jgi:DNA-binding LacI/PurR family transcriptional regulator
MVPRLFRARNTLGCPSVNCPSDNWHASCPLGLGWFNMVATMNTRHVPHRPLGPRGRPTIMDVARLAGVSRGTVSRVINGGQNVRPVVVERVTAAIDSLDYSVNQSARSLRRGHTGSIAFVISERQEHLFEDPNFGVLVRLLSRQLREQGCHLLITTAEDEDEESFVGDYLSAGHVDGALLAQPHDNERLLDQLSVSKLPLVVLGKPVGWEDSFSWITVDNACAAYDATMFLKARGCSVIATITGPLDTSSARERLEGYRTALGDQFRPDLVAGGDWSLVSGQLSASELFQRDREIDGLFVASDLMAVGAVRALKEASLRVPEDVAVVGFDDSAAATMTDPPLTTIRNPFELFTLEAVRMLDTLLVNPAAGPMHVVLSGELVRRDSA